MYCILYVTSSLYFLQNIPPKKALGGQRIQSTVPGNIELNTARTIVLLVKGWLAAGLKTGTQRRTRMK